jgi:hypothetical protein
MYKLFKCFTNLSRVLGKTLKEKDTLKFFPGRDTYKAMSWKEAVLWGSSRPSGHQRSKEEKEWLGDWPGVTTCPHDFLLREVPVLKDFTALKLLSLFLHNSFLTGSNGQQSQQHKEKLPPFSSQ